MLRSRIHRRADVGQGRAMTDLFAGAAAYGHYHRAPAKVLHVVGHAPELMKVAPIT